MGGKTGKATYGSVFFPWLQINFPGGEASRGSSQSLYIPSSKIIGRGGVLLRAVRFS